MNQPTTIDFDKADGMTSTQVCIRNSERKNYHVSLLFFQDIALTPAQLESGELIPLKFVKFQNVQNLQLFIRYDTHGGDPYNLSFRDNQAGEEVTVVDQLHIIGTLILAPFSIPSCYPLAPV